MSSWRWGERLRTVGRVSGALAALAVIVVGCQVTTEGSARVDSSGAPIYRASVSSSVAAASSRSSASESARQTSMTKQAVKDSCDTLTHSTVDSIEAVNAFVRAINGGSSDGAAKAGPAVDTLNRGADLVLATLSGPVPPELANAMRAWADASRKVAGTISRAAGMAEFNAAINEFNAAKKTALDLCRAAS